MLLQPTAQSWLVVEGVLVIENRFQLSLAAVWLLNSGR
jgi:hypothetical protein